MAGSSPLRIPSAHLIFWGVAFGLLAIFLSQNVAFVGNLTRSRA